MKRLILIFICVFTSLGFCQEKNKFPQGFNPDGKIGAGILTLYGGMIHETYNFSNKKFVDVIPNFGGTLAFPLDKHSTLSIQINYSKDLDKFIQGRFWYFGAGIKLFGGMD